MKERALQDPAVAAAFSACAEPMRSRLLALRSLILDVAAETPAIGPLIETLKWGDPAYLPARPRIGTTIRINAHKGGIDTYGLYINCRTSLADTFRSLYPGVFTIEGDRALVFGPGARLPTEPLKTCIALALTYHLRARSSVVP